MSNPFLEKCLSDTPSPSTWEQQSIYKVPPRIREQHPEAYEPLVVSIGPYHHGKSHLDPMEEHKFRAVRHFLKRTGQGAMRGLVQLLETAGLLPQLKAAYATLPAEWKEDQVFLHLMVLDGCFLLELLLTSGDYCQNAHGCTPRCYSEEDPFFGAPNGVRQGLLPYIRHDLLLIENQLPMLVLQELSKQLLPSIEINDLIRNYYNLKSEGQAEQPRERLHVLDVYRWSCIRGHGCSCWTSPMSARHLSYYGVNFHVNPAYPRSFRNIDFKITESSMVGAAIADMGSPISSLYFVLRWIYRDFHRILKDMVPVPSPLAEAVEGSEILPVAHGNDDQHTGFSTGVVSSFLMASNVRLSVLTERLYEIIDSKWVSRANLTLPALVVDETTESLLLNLMAFERLHLGSRPLAVTWYVLLMCSLLPSDKDVALLRSKKILSCVPERQDKDVVTLFERISKGIVVDTGGQLGMANQEIVDFCRRRTNSYMALYFALVDDPKARVTQLLAIYGLVFTLVSSFLAILSYVRPPKRTGC